MRSNFGNRRGTVRRVIAVTLCYLAISSSPACAKSVVLQKIGFAGGLNSEESKEKERSPIFSAAGTSTSTNYHPSHFYGDRDRNREYSRRNDRHLTNHHSHEEHHGIQYNKLPAFGPRSQPEYDHPQKYNQIYSNSAHAPSPYRKIYALAPVPSPSPSSISPSEDYRNVVNVDEQQPDPKKYAFAYAVRDGHNGDDFSHKESRDGKVTMGEYKVLLPDGRLQVVRYTADALAGFKADVTYEGEDHPSDLSPSSTPKPAFLSPAKAPSSAVHKHYAAAPLGHAHDHARTHDLTNAQSPSPSPIYVSTGLKSRPSLSPSIIYADADRDRHDDHYLFHRSIPHHAIGGPTPNSIHAHAHAHGHSQPTSPSILYKINPTSYKYKKTLDSPPPSPTFASFLSHALGKGLSPSNPTTTTYYGHGHSSTPKNIYEKIHATVASPSKEPYSAIPRGYRAGPLNSYKKVPLYKVISSGPSPSPSHSPSTASILAPRKILKLTPVTPSGEPMAVTRKSRLVPVEFFKAGPYDPHRQGSNPGFEGHGHAHAQSRPHHQQQHYILEQHHDDHVVEEHHYQQPQQQQHVEHFPPIKSTFATYTSGFPATPKPSLFIKSQSTHSSQPRPLRPSVSGLVFLETPGQGTRPNAAGVKELLDRIPHGNLIQPKTTTHPYELGAKDYGTGVGYGIPSPTEPSGGSGNSNRPFIPSQHIPNEYIPKLDTGGFRHHSREYLTDGGEESIVSYANEDGNEGRN